MKLSTKLVISLLMKQPGFALQETVHSATFKTWHSATNLYLMTKASNKCDKFMANSKLKEQGQKVDGIWMSRHRLSHAGSPFHGINKDPFLIYKDSLLAGAIGILSHNITSQEAIFNRPSANGHKAWSTVHNHSLNYGVIIGGGPMFKRIEDKGAFNNYISALEWGGGSKHTH